jgi:hypothetical protein
MKDSQCSYNVTLRCYRETLFDVEKQSVLHILSVCVCVLCGMQSACAVLSCYLSGLFDHTMCLHFLTQQYLRKILLSINCVF